MTINEIIKKEKLVTKLQKIAVKHYKPVTPYILEYYKWKGIGYNQEDILSYLAKGDD